MQLVETAHTVSHFQRAVLRIGDYLIVLALALVVLILAVGAVPRRQPDQYAAVRPGPDGGGGPGRDAHRALGHDGGGCALLAREQAIVSRLAAIEELAGHGRAVLGQDRHADAEPPDAWGAVLLRRDTRPRTSCCRGAGIAGRETRTRSTSPSWRPAGGPASWRAYRPLHFQPFDPVHKRTEAEVAGPDGAAFRVSKGAPQVILALSARREALGAQVEAAVTAFAARGFRSLGVAGQTEAGPWRFLGILPLYDPPRDDARTRRCRPHGRWASG